jgi:hypothetical protein
MIFDLSSNPSPRPGCVHFDITYTCTPRPFDGSRERDGPRAPSVKIVLDWDSCQIISDSASNQLIPAHSRLDRAFLCCRLRGAGRAHTLVGVFLQALVSGYRLHNGGIDRRVSRWHSLKAIHWRWRAPKVGENQGAGFPAAHVIERRSN